MCGKTLRYRREKLTTKNAESTKNRLTCIFFALLALFVVEIRPLEMYMPGSLLSGMRSWRLGVEPHSPHLTAGELETDHNDRYML